ncbi:periplasmic heavy metal sensor [Sulfitobacter sp. PS-8MA]|uniref:periplasmic heavy metal sensor n=1 Tax=Sulfitobacter sp. PS-8MA TaxID=3237707 RepID=UPI0034C6A095
MTSSKTPRNRRLLRWALGLSLALNLLVLSAIGGALWRHRGMGPGRDHLPGLRSYATPYVQALPQERRRALHRDMHAGQQAPHLNRQARRAHYAQMLAALRAEPFDPAAAQAVLTRQSDAVASVQTAAHAAWLAQVGAMSTAERSAYADALETQLKDRAWGRGRRPHESP